MADWYLGSVQYNNVPQWGAGQVVNVGDFRRQLATPTINNERVFRCTTAGTTGGAEPAWNLSTGGTTNDNGVVWTEVTGNSTYAWSAPHLRLRTILNRTSTGNEDRIFVAHDHAETQASDMALSFHTPAAGKANQILCVDTAGSVPPVSADLRTTATISVTGSSDIFFQNGFFYVYGVQFIAGSTTSLSEIRSVTTTTDQVSDWTLENCLLKIAGSSASGGIFAGSAGLVNRPADATRLTLINTAVEFAAVTQGVTVAGSVFTWKNTASPISGAIIPTVLIEENTGSCKISRVLLDGLDLTAISTGKTIIDHTRSGSRFVLLNCKFDASGTIATTQTTGQGCIGSVDVICSDASGTHDRQERYKTQGVLTREATIVRTGGADDGQGAMSWKVVTTANIGRYVPFDCFEIMAFLDTVGGPVTATVELLTDNVTLNNAQAWVELEYLGASTSPLSSRITSQPADPLAASANLTTSTANWNTTGLGTPVKQKIDLTFTPQIAGLVRATVKIARASTTVYVDPKLTFA